MAEDPQTAWTSVYCLREYNPYRLFGELNPLFRRETDGRLLDLKDNSDRGVSAAATDFRSGLDSLNLADGTVIAIVPGHEAIASNEGRPLARAAQALATMDKRYISKVDSLIRTTTVPKKTAGGIRSTSVDLNSIKANPADVAGAVVVVLDDTATTGGSLMAARQLLEAAGAARVAAVAIGRTVKYY
jgi:predicted amidophosphoribosyltransferase